MAPRVRYPDHHHRPEEAYFAFSLGSWRQGENERFEPAGIFYNEPDIMHTML